MPAATQTDVINKVIQELKALDLSSIGVRSSDVFELDFPFNGKPPTGIIVSRLKEDEVGSLNNARDVMYPIQVMRVGQSLNNAGGDRRSAWRELVSGRFSYTRLGLEGELKTYCRFMEIELDAKWATSNVDASVLRIETFIRKP
jgi:hypothetical protein